MEIEVIVRISKSEDTITTTPMVYSEEELKAMAKRIATTDNEVYKAKWTANGLIYTHKMNAKGEFEEIVKSQEQIKAEAFDVLKDKLEIDLFYMDLGEDGILHLMVCPNENGEPPLKKQLSKEEYEILKKAGIE